MLYPFFCMDPDTISTIVIGINNTTRKGEQLPEATTDIPFQCEQV